MRLKFNYYSQASVAEEVCSSSPCPGSALAVGYLSSVVQPVAPRAWRCVCPPEHTKMPLAAAALFPRALLISLFCYGCEKERAASERWRMTG